MGRFVQSFRGRHEEVEMQGKKLIIFAILILFMTQVAYASSTDVLFMINHPVCGNDGITYQNQYYAEGANVAYTEGACSTTTVTSTQTNVDWNLIAIMFVFLLIYIKYGD